MISYVECSYVECCVEFFFLFIFFLSVPHIHSCHSFLVFFFFFVLAILNVSKATKETLSLKKNRIKSASNHNTYFSKAFIWQRWFSPAAFSILHFETQSTDCPNWVHQQHERCEDNWALCCMMALQSPLTVLSAVATCQIQLRAHLQCWVEPGKIRVDCNISFIIRLLQWKELRVAGFLERCEPLIWLTSVMDGLSKSPQLSNNSSNDKESQSGHITAGLQRQLSKDRYDHHRPVCSGSTC